MQPPGHAVLNLRDPGLERYHRSVRVLEWVGWYWDRRPSPVTPSLNMAGRTETGGSDAGCHELKELARPTNESNRRSRSINHVEASDGAKLKLIRKPATTGRAMLTASSRDRCARVVCRPSR